jgi:DNA-binding SARP family transcriptional activator/tetratricopeptide (TPR) repeat protein
VEPRVEFGLLGPLAVRSGSTAVTTLSGKQRTVMAALLLKAGRVVSLDELTEILWGDSPPPSARVSAQNHVMRLRKALGDAAGSRISTRAPGYQIRVDPAELDLSRFEEHLDAARAAARNGSWEAAATHARGALQLWRGDPLADVESDVLATRERPRLAELQVKALELRIEADLCLGGHAEVIAELRQLAAEHPLRERISGLLMLALYRDGRQAEALAAFQRARAVLVEELGVEPGPDLQELHRQILSADPALAVAKSARRAPTEPQRVTPRELPPAVADFTGRAAELRALTRILDQAGAEVPGTVVISAIGGTAGVGKTALALHWAHEFAHRFPDGQLYVNLRGFALSDNPVAPAEAIRGFLDALGVPPTRIPPDPQAQAGLYRSLLADRTMLVMLDNARDEQQVRPLLPASPGSLVIITSRRQLGGLTAADAARLLTLDVLSHTEAVQLLTARLGTARAAAEPEALSEISSLCACLPLALGVAAARAAVRPGFPLAALAAELRDHAHRLDVLDSGDPASNVRAVFGWSTWQLSDPAARMFRLLGVHRGPDISVPAAASLAGVPQADAHHLLRELASAHLIAEHVPGRFSFHDLLRAYAAEQALDTASELDRDEAVGRVLDHYLHTADRAGRLLIPTKAPVVIAPPRPGVTPEQPADYRQALAWFEEEHQVLLAAIALATESGFDRHAWQLPWAVASFLRARGHYQECAATLRTALTAATHLGDTTAQALCSRSLAAVYYFLGDYDESSDLNSLSLTLSQQIGDRFGEAKVRHSLSVIADKRGRYPEALAHAEEALRLYRAIGNKALEAEGLNCVGWCHGLLGDFQQTRAFCREALARSEEVGNRRLGGASWDSLGYAEHQLGNLAEAANCYQNALGLYREIGDRFYEASTLTHLGDARQAAGDLEQARDAWKQALAIFVELDLPDADEVRAKLAALDAR